MASPPVSGSTVVTVCLDSVPLCDVVKISLSTSTSRTGPKGGAEVCVYGSDVGPSKVVGSGPVSSPSSLSLVHVSSCCMGSDMSIVVVIVVYHGLALAAIPVVV